MPRPRKPASPFRYFNSSPEVIRLVVMMYVRFPLSLRNVEDLLFERGIDICHETVRHWWNRFGPLFEDRPHVFKLFTTYAATSRVMTSAYFRAQSGTPWAARGRDAAGAVLNYLEPAGSHRNPVWANLDLMASYRLPLSNRHLAVQDRRLLS